MSSTLAKQYGFFTYGNFYTSLNRAKALIVERTQVLFDEQSDASVLQESWESIVIQPKSKNVKLNIGVVYDVNQLLGLVAKADITKSSECKTLFYLVDQYADKLAQDGVLDFVMANLSSDDDEIEALSEQWKDQIEAEYRALGANTPREIAESIAGSKLTAMKNIILAVKSRPDILVKLFPGVVSVLSTKAATDLFTAYQRIGESDNTIPTITALLENDNSFEKLSRQKGAMNIVGTVLMHNIERIIAQAKDPVKLSLKIEPLLRRNSDLLLRAATAFEKRPNGTDELREFANIGPFFSSKPSLGALMRATIDRQLKDGNVGDDHRNMIEALKSPKIRYRMRIQSIDVIRAMLKELRRGNSQSVKELGKLIAGERALYTKLTKHPTAFKRLSQESPYIRARETFERILEAEYPNRIWTFRYSREAFVVNRLVQSIIFGGNGNSPIKLDAEVMQQVMALLLNSDLSMHLSQAQKDILEGKSIIIAANIKGKDVSHLVRDEAYRNSELLEQISEDSIVAHELAADLLQQSIELKNTFNSSDRLQAVVASQASHFSLTDVRRAKESDRFELTADMLTHLNPAVVNQMGVEVLLSFFNLDGFFDYSVATDRHPAAFDKLFHYENSDHALGLYMHFLNPEGQNKAQIQRIFEAHSHMANHAVQNIRVTVDERIALVKAGYGDVRAIVNAQAMAKHDLLEAIITHPETDEVVIGSIEAAIIAHLNDDTVPFSLTAQKALLGIDSEFADIRAAFAERYSRNYKAIQPLLNDSEFSSLRSSTENHKVFTTIFAAKAGDYSPKARSLSSVESTSFVSHSTTVSVDSMLPLDGAEAYASLDFAPNTMLNDTGEVVDLPPPIVATTFTEESTVSMLPPITREQLERTSPLVVIPLTAEQLGDFSPPPQVTHTEVKSVPLSPPKIIDTMLIPEEKNDPVTVDFSTESAVEEVVLQDGEGVADKSEESVLSASNSAVDIESKPLTETKKATLEDLPLPPPPQGFPPPPPPPIHTEEQKLSFNITAPLPQDLPPPRTVTEEQNLAPKINTSLPEDLPPPLPPRPTVLFTTQPDVQKTLASVAANDNEQDQAEGPRPRFALLDALNGLKRNEDGSVNMKKSGIVATSTSVVTKPVVDNSLKGTLMSALKGMRNGIQDTPPGSPTSSPTLSRSNSFEWT